MAFSISEEAALIMQEQQIFLQIPYTTFASKQSVENAKLMFSFTLPFVPTFEASLWKRTLEIMANYPHLLSESYDYSEEQVFKRGTSQEVGQDRIATPFNYFN